MTGLVKVAFVGSQESVVQADEVGDESPIAAVCAANSCLGTLVPPCLLCAMERDAILYPGYLRLPRETTPRSAERVLRIGNPTMKELLKSGKMRSLAHTVLRTSNSNVYSSCRSWFPGPATEPRHFYCGRAPTAAANDSEANTLRVEKPSKVRSRKPLQLVSAELDRNAPEIDPYAVPFTAFSTFKVISVSI
ncbi:hypothetical protein C8R44DRAFT_738604 [Mycena epipterygia]|nr:hypothetical protein C8R44DRAFT_738604 [Mycena epipterygia]